MTALYTVPHRPQDTYGLEKLYHEEMCIAYAKDFPIKTRMARFHNVYGPRGTWKVTITSNSYRTSLSLVWSFDRQECDSSWF